MRVDDVDWKLFNLGSNLAGKACVLVEEYNTLLRHGIRDPRVLLPIVQKAERYLKRGIRYMDKSKQPRPPKPTRPAFSLVP